MKQGMLDYVFKFFPVTLVTEHITEAKDLVVGQLRGEEIRAIARQLLDNPDRDYLEYANLTGLTPSEFCRRRERLMAQIRSLLTDEGIALDGASEIEKSMARRVPFFRRQEN